MNPFLEGRLANWFTKTRIQNGKWQDQPLRFRFYVNMLEFGRRLQHFWHIYWLELTFSVVVFVILSVLSK